MESALNGNMTAKEGKKYTQRADETRLLIDELEEKKHLYFYLLMMGHLLTFEQYRVVYINLAYELLCRL
jgi:hypothetical protein